MTSSVLASARPTVAPPLTFLYRVFTAADELLYIGITANLQRRIDDHRSNAPWWSEVDHLTVKVYGSREAAVIAERDAIKTEHPPHNVVHLPSPGPERRAGRARQPPQRSYMKQFADNLLGEPVEQWIARRRPRQGPKTSYRHLAAELREATGGRIDISMQAISKWCQDTDEGDRP